MEYGALVWMSSAATHMKRLDEAQRRAVKLVDTDEHQQPVYVMSLENQCNMSALMVVILGGNERCSTT